jgi:hypothetical protein
MSPMWRKYGHLPIICTLAAVLATAWGQLPASAAGSATWRIVKVFGASYGDPNLSGGTAVSATDSWVVGNTYLTSSSLFLARSHGARWARVRVPAKFRDMPQSSSLSDGVVAATKSAAWTFPTVYSRRTHTYALRLTGGTWTTYELPDAFQISAAAAFGQSDVWAFGFAVPPKPVLGFGPPFAARFDGHAWHRVPMPGVPLSVSVLSSTDIWAFGPTARTAGDFAQVYIAMHWTGAGWHTMRLPRMRAANGKLAFPADLAVLPGNSLWMTQEFHCLHPGCEQAEQPGILLAHWNGKAWVRVLDDSSYETAQVEPDGTGGLWITTLDTLTSSFVYLRYDNGQAISMPVPATTQGATGNVGPPIPIPGTTSAWGTGDVAEGGSTSAGAVFRL